MEPYHTTKLAELYTIVVPFLVKQNWNDVLRNTFIPTIHFNKEFIGILVAILGTTISPYLFFWQTTMEAEEIEHAKHKIVVNKHFMGRMQNDVIFGMFFSVLIMFFIILTSPVKTLIYTAILYGITSPVMIAIILHICNNKKIMKEF